MKPKINYGRKINNVLIATNLIYFLVDHFYTVRVRPMMDFPFQINFSLHPQYFNDFCSCSFFIRNSWETKSKKMPWLTRLAWSVKASTASRYWRKVTGWPTSFALPWNEYTILIISHTTSNANTTVTDVTSSLTSLRLQLQAHLFLHASHRSLNSGFPDQSYR